MHTKKFKLVGRNPIFTLLDVYLKRIFTNYSNISMYLQVCIIQNRVKVCGRISFESLALICSTTAASMAREGGGDQIQGMRDGLPD
jgi:hypothetical protein